MRFIFLLSLFIFSFSCKKTGETTGISPTLPHHDTTLPVSKIFGFDNQQKYAYCPSIIVQGTERHIWFCGNQPAGVFSDHIYYVRGDADYGSRIPKIVLSPGAAGSWDDRHVCDPSVVKGEFKFNGTTYPYAMFYLGNRSDRYYNEIGIAFAQTMDADTWIKYPSQLVKKTWTGDDDWPIGNGKAWGVGQPSAFSVDGKGKVILTYTIGDASGTRVVLRQANLSDMDDIDLSVPKAVSVAGLTKLDYSAQNIVLANADFAFDSSRSAIYMTSQVLPNPGSYPAFISAAVDLNKMPYNDFINGGGTWKLVQRIGPSVSGFPRNHNSGIGRDAFGAVPDVTKAEHYFTVSKADPDVSPDQDRFAEWTYHIYVYKNVDLTK
jgi:hypothetical protein